VHTSHHVVHWASWFGTGLAVIGAIDGDTLTRNSGVILAIVCSAVSAIFYVKRIRYASALERSAMKEDYRREQELKEATHKAQLARITSGPLSINECRTE
jgi:hypothetical protein